jgi:hypothetical protein
MELDWPLFAELGVFSQAYLSVKSMLGIDWESLDSTKWYHHMKDQVRVLNDPRVDLDEAYRLLEDKQKYLCKRCNTDLTLDKRPVLRKKDSPRHFLCFNSVETRFDFFCSDCASTTETERMERVHDEIEAAFTDAPMGLIAA